MIKKLVGAFRLYRFGIFRIYLNKLIPSFFQFQTFLIYRFDLGELKEQPENTDVEFIRVEHPDHETFQLFQESFPAKIFEERLKETNQIMYVALKNKQVSGYGWLATSYLDIETIQYNYSLKSDEAFIHACYVPKHCRGMGIYSAMLRKMLLDSKNEGFKKVYIGVSSANAGSVRGIEKTGFKFQNKIIYGKFWKREWWKGEVPIVTKGVTAY